MLSVSAVLLLLVGLQILLIGMVADGVLRRIGQGNRGLAPSHAIRSYELLPGLQNVSNDQRPRETLG
jgi:hypothetical protein